MWMFNGAKKCKTNLAGIQNPVLYETSVQDRLVAVKCKEL